MRGKVFDALDNGVKDGITPAYAGKSATVRHMRAKNRDHPRLCGEKSPVKINAFRNSGSPPPMRGKASDQNAE